MKRFIAILMTLIMVLGLSSVGVWADDEATWQEETPMQIGRCLHECQSWNGKIYVFGGGISSGRSNSTEIFDLETEIWSMGAPMPTARNMATSAIIGDKIYVVGGMNDYSTLSTVEIYDLQSNSWTTGASMPTAKRAMEAAVVDGKIYVLGGYSGETTSSVEIYDPQNNSWTAGTPMPNQRVYHCVSVVNNKIYVIGGQSTSKKLAVVDIYDPETDEWDIGADIPTPINGHPTCISYKEKIYVIGGASDSAPSIVEIYDTQKDSWSVGPSLPMAIVNLSSALIGNQIFVTGGQDSSAILNKVFSLELEVLPANPLEQPSSLTATGGNSVVDLSWGAVSGADSYTVKRSLKEGGPYTVIAEGITDTTYSDTDVVNGTTYYYVVTAVSAGGESENSNEASATPGASTSSGKALLVITMTNGLEKEYDLQMSEVNNFIDWYDSKAAGNGQGYYTISKTFNLGPFMTRTDYLTFDKIQNFEVMQYE